MILRSLPSQRSCGRFARGLLPAALTGCFLVASCTSDSEPTDSPASRVAAGASSGESATYARNACELLTAEEVASVAGEPVEARAGDEQSPDRSSCVYASPGSEWEVMWLTVTWRDGQQEWDVQQTGRGIGGRMMSTEGVDMDSILRPDPLAGVGDAAYYGGILPSLVLKGDVLLEFMMPLLRNDREHFPELAKKAVSRL